MMPLRSTPLNSWHTAHHGKMVDFAGWSMPVQYASIVEEHQATRTHCGLFDISHMGRLRFTGPDAPVLLDRLLTRKVIGMGAGKVRYSLVTNESGGILDDVLVYRLNDTSEARNEHGADANRLAGADGEFYLLVVNASNREKIVTWIQQHVGDLNVSPMDDTFSTAMIAVQGPNALQLAQPLFELKLSELGYYSGAVTKSCGQTVIVSRTGYTGEDGIELVVPAASALDFWQKLIAAGAKPVGLGARDTLRLEAAMPLYGHELSESLTPLHADLGFAVNLKEHVFVGCEALAKLQSDSLPKRVGIELTGKRVPREHYAVYLGDRQVGEVTSGTFSPTLQRPIAMAYVHPDAAAEGTELRIDIRGSREPGRVVRLPFYSRTR